MSFSTRNLVARVASSSGGSASTVDRNAEATKWRDDRLQAMLEFGLCLTGDGYKSRNKRQYHNYSIPATGEHPARGHSACRVPIQRFADVLECLLECLGLIKNLSFIRSHRLSLT